MRYLNAVLLTSLSFTVCYLRSLLHVSSSSSFFFAEPAVVAKSNIILSVKPVRINVHTLARAHTHTHTLAHTHARTRTHMHTHTCAHTYNTHNT